jgi:glutamate N-acetyltransferase / amino-acid N-acetyltransferase
MSPRASGAGKRPQEADPAAGCPGFRFAGVAAGIKKTGNRDVALLATDAPAATAAVFTQNRVQAAPVRLSAEHLRKHKKLRGIVINSGNANACTGAQGMRDAKEMAARAAEALGSKAEELLVASTGVIGNRLPMGAVRSGIAAAGLELRADGFADFADAILTTDKRAKIAALRTRIDGAPVTLLGCTKGAGMIMPNMATTLTFVVTDASCTPAQLQAATARAVAPTFNAIAVDGDTSTNDTLAVMASGLAGGGGAATAVGAAALTEALTALLSDLAQQLMTDGEGVHHVVSIEVRRAASKAAAARIAQRVAISPLVKTAIAGADPNWGRILCAVGNAGVAIDPDRLALTIGDVATVARGSVRPNWDEAAARAAMQAPRYKLVVDLGMGEHAASYLACDLSHDYVSINASYRS